VSSPQFDLALSFSDSTQARITDPSDFFVNTSLSGWDGARLHFFTLNEGVAAVFVASGTVTDVFVVPEPAPVPLGPWIMPLATILIGASAFQLIRSGRRRH
jgi:hypothetical protein